jgi:hypothetical protein
LNVNYSWQNYCTKCGDNYPKTVGLKCPYCGYKMRTVQHFSRVKREHKRY